MTVSTDVTSKGSTKGSILLITGCCVGAGMIGLPMATALSGFFPSFLVFLFSWAFMISTGLLLLEANLWFKEKVNLLSMAESILGQTGKYICGGLFLFLFFSLIIAYLSGAGVLLTNYLSLVFGKTIPSEVGVFACTAFTGWAFFKGTAKVDHINRICIFGMVFSYLFIVTLGLPKIEIQNLMHSNFSRSTLLSIPVIIIAFGYQNLIPSLTVYLKRDVEKIKKVIFLGCSIPFLIYIIWEIVIFGLIHPDTLASSIGGKENLITTLLSRSIESSSLNIFIGLFSFFALITSLLTVALSCGDFLSDVVKLKNQVLNRLILCSLVLVFPTMFSIYDPNLFLKGLSLAGGLGAVVLFGVVPVAMVWIGRYRKGKEENVILPGGRFSLILLLSLALIIFFTELLRQFNIL